jgi:multidrug efflux pump subunit AcrA (membrane-fusion protein)
MEIKRSYSTLQELEKLNISSTKEVKISWAVGFLAYSLVAILILFVLSLIFVPWVQTVQGVGQVIGFYASDRQQDIQAPVDGRIKQWFVSEGMKVKAGQAIMDLVDLDPLIIERLNQEKDAAEIKLNAAVVSRDTSLKNLERQQSLAKKGLSSMRALELAQIEYQKFLGDISSATAELTRVESRLSRQTNQSVVAPRDGIIMRVLVPQGEGIFVKAGTPLARLVPETEELGVEIKVRGNDMPLISEGRNVRLQFEGWPAIQFAGWPSVAVGTFPALVKVVDPSDDGSGNFRIIVVPEHRNDWPAYPHLRQGVRTHAWVLLDTVSIGWEIWRQLNGFPPSVKNAPNVDSAKK